MHTKKDFFFEQELQCYFGILFEKQQARPVQMKTKMYWEGRAE